VSTQAEALHSRLAVLLEMSVSRNKKRAYERNPGTSASCENTNNVTANRLSTRDAMNLESGTTNSAEWLNGIDSS